MTDEVEPPLNELLPALPGTGEIMASVGHCFSACWHAAHGGNYDLAAYFLRRTRGLLLRLVVVRPKYAEQVAVFDRDRLESVHQALLSRDVAAFETAFERAVDGANVYHVDTGHPYIRWSVPHQPPDLGLDLTQ